MLHSHHPYSKAVQLSAKRDALTQASSHRGKWDYVTEYLASLECCQRGPVLSHLIQNTEVIHVTNRQGEFGSIPGRAQNTSRHVDHTSSCTALGSLPTSCWDASPTDYPLHQMAHRHFQCSACLTPTPTHISHSWLPVQAPEGNKYSPLQTASEYAQKAGPTQWDWEKAPKLKHSASTLEKANGRLSAPTWLCMIKTRNTIFKKNFFNVYF